MSDREQISNPGTDTGILVVTASNPVGPESGGMGTKKLFSGQNDYIPAYQIDPRTIPKPAENLFALFEYANQKIGETNRKKRSNLESSRLKSQQEKMRAGSNNGGKVPEPELDLGDDAFFDEVMEGMDEEFSGETDLPDVSRVETDDPAQETIPEPIPEIPEKIRTSKIQEGDELDDVPRTETPESETFPDPPLHHSVIWELLPLFDSHPKKTDSTARNGATPADKFVSGWPLKILESAEATGKITEEEWASAFSRLCSRWQRILRLRFAKNFSVSRISNDEASGCADIRAILRKALKKINDLLS